MQARDWRLRMQQWEICTIKVKRRWGLFKSAWRWIAVLETEDKPTTIAQSREYSVATAQDADTQAQELATIVQTLAADGWEQIGPYRFRRALAATQTSLPGTSEQGAQAQRMDSQP